MEFTLEADREGTFRGEITEYWLREYESGATAIVVRANLLEMYDGEEWVPWAEYGQFATGNLFVIKKDGNLSTKSVESIMESAGWDGRFVSIIDSLWKPTECQLVLKENEYQGNVNYQIAFVNPVDSTPGGGLTNVDSAKAKAMDSKYGSQLRALKGNASRNNSPPPASKPASPPKQEARPPSSDIPF